MARTSRYVSSTGIYHVMMRGIDHRNIYRDNTDKDKFLNIMHSVLSRNATISGKSSGEYEVYAYALMGNHFHLLLKVLSGSLGDFVKALSASYVLYFNKKYHRDGHLFKERFKSEACESEEYFITLLRYIHQNPIKAGFATDLLRYKYTSWQEYADPENATFRICSVEDVLSKIPLIEMERNIYDLLSEADEKDCIDIDKRSGLMSDAYVEERIHSLLSKEGLSDIAQLSKEKRHEIFVELLKAGAGICQIGRLTGASKATVSRLKNKLQDK